MTSLEDPGEGEVAVLPNYTTYIRCIGVDRLVASSMEVGTVGIVNGEGYGFATEPVLKQDGQ